MLAPRRRIDTQRSAPRTVKERSSVSFGVSDAVSSILKTAIDGLTARQNVTADNIANVDTPDFHATTVSFEDALKQAIQNGSYTGSDSSLPQIPITTVPTDTPIGANGNNVDIRHEEVSLIQTQYSYQIMGRAITDHYDLMKTALTQIP